MSIKKEQLKKNNHITPKCLLKQWKVVENGREGVHVYQTQKQKYSFSSAIAGQRSYSFAIEEYFYVPEINDKRTNALENWFSGIEATLDFALLQFNKHSEDHLLRNSQDFTKLLLALFSLKNRTKYDILKQKEHLLANPDLISKMGNGSRTDIDIIVLENLVNATTYESAPYFNCEIIVWKNRSGSLILGDRPFLLDVVDGFSFLTLSPYYFITIKKTAKRPEFLYQETDEKFVEFINKQMASHSRNWIVANDKNNLEMYIPILKSESDGDIPDLVLPEIPFMGYNFK
jgi:hypothetical protein